MTYDPQDFEASLLPSEDLIMSMSSGDYVVIGGLRMEMDVVTDVFTMLGMVYLSAEDPEPEDNGDNPWYGLVHVRGNQAPRWRGACWDKQHLAKSIAAGEFWIG